MHSVTLSSETIVDIAKDMLTALECEWKMSNGKVCGAVLGSWHLLEKVCVLRIYNLHILHDILLASHDPFEN